MPFLLLKRLPIPNKQPEDSPDPSFPRAVVGRVLGSHGVHGEIRIQSLTDLPYRFDPGEQVFLDGRAIRIQASSRGSGDTLLLKLEGIDSPSRARELIGRELQAQAEDAPDLPDGEYFHYQLIGMQVFTEEGEDLGTIAEIIITGSNDVYVVTGPSGDLLLPALSQVILEVDTSSGRMTVRLMEGLR